MLGKVGLGGFSELLFHADGRLSAYPALWTGYALNIAIGLQVFFGALTTGVAAAASSDKQARISL